MQKEFSETPFEGYFIPFSAQIDERTVISKSGLISQTVKVLPTSHTAFKENLVTALKNLLTPDILFNIHAVHSNSTQNAYTSFDDYLRLSQMRHFSRHSEYEHEFYITISLPGYKIDKSTVSNFLLQNRFLLEIQRSTKVLHDAVEKFCNAIKGYNPKVLSLFIKENVVYSASSTFLYKILFASNAQIPIADMEVSDQIKPSSIKIRPNYLIIKRGGEKKFIACLTVKDFPHINDDDIVKIFTSKHPFTLTQTIHHARNNEIRPLFEYQAKTAVSLRGNKIAEMASWRSILDDPNPIAMQTNILLYGQTAQELEAYVKEMSKVLANMGIVAIREDVNLEQAFYASMPANPTFLNRIEFANIVHAGQFLLSKNMLFSGVDEVQHLPFMPTVSVAGKHFALSPFAVSKAKHMLFHGIQARHFLMFQNILLANVSQGVRVVSLDYNYSTLALNKIRGGVYLQDVQVNMLNLLRLNRKHFFVFFSHFVDFYLKQHSIQKTDALLQAVRDFCLKLKPELKLQEVRKLTVSTSLTPIVDYAVTLNLFAEQDMLSSSSGFISVNTNKLDDTTYSIKALYVMLATLHTAGRGKTILKLDRSFDAFHRGIIPQELMLEILKEAKMKNLSLIACMNIPQHFEHDKTYVYTEVLSKFDISVFMEATCSTQFVKMFFQINSQVAKQLMFVKAGTKKAVIKTAETVYTIKLEENFPMEKMRVFDSTDPDFKPMLKMIENHKSSHLALIKEYEKFIKSA